MQDEKFKQNHRRWQLIHKLLKLHYFPITSVRVSEYSIIVDMRFNRRFIEFAALQGWQPYLSITTGTLTIDARSRRTRIESVVFHINES